MLDLLGYLVAIWPLVAASSLQLDFHKVPQPQKGLERRGHAEAPLVENPLHIEYFINISVGTPPQPIQLQFDTGSSDVWFPSVDANACNNSRCELHGAFNSSESSTFNNASNVPFVAAYGSGQAHGSHFSDVLSIAGTKLDNFTMGLARRFTSPTPNGILGIGPDVLQAAAAVGTGPVVPGVLDALLASGTIERRAFSVYLDDQESERGSVLFGGIDTSRFTPPLTALALTKNASGVYDRYRVDLTSVAFTDADGISTTLSADNMTAPAILDTGVTQLYLPSHVASGLAEGFGAVTLDETYFVDCEYRASNATLAFQFGGVGGPSITVPMNQLITDPTGLEFDNKAQACILNVAPGELSEKSSPGLGGYSLGDPFIRNAYIVYDVDNLEVYIAQAVLNHTGGSKIQDIHAGSGLPMASSTVAGTATLLPLPTEAANSTAAASSAASTADNGSGTDSSTGSVIPTAPASPRFSLGVTANASTAAASSASSTSNGAALTSDLGQLVLALVFGLLVLLL